jgi:hypothetical protein
MMDVGVLKRVVEGRRMAPRLFVSRFVSGCHRSAGCGLQDIGYGWGSLAIDHGP